MIDAQSKHPMDRCFEPSNMKRILRRFAATLIAITCFNLVQAQGYTSTFYTPAAGDAQYSWNSRYAGDTYTGVGANTVGAGSTFYSGTPSDTQYTVGIFMLPISALAGGELYSATLTVRSNGFSTWYYYGSASIGWLDTGSMILTGDVVADGLGPAAKSQPGGFQIYNSDIGGSAAAGNYYNYDVATYVQADLNAGRSFSTFVLSTSRDTSGSLHSAESGSGPMLVVLSSIPEPTTYAALAGVFALVLAFWRRRSSH